MSETHTRYIAKPKLKKLLKSKKYKDKYRNQKDLAIAVGVKDPTISRFDNQARYDINTLVSISKELEISIEELFDIEENPNYIKVETPEFDQSDLKSAAEFIQYLLKENIVTYEADEDGLPKTVKYSDYIPDSEKDKITKFVLDFSNSLDNLNPKS